jgi:hypothetical protein
MKNKNINKDNGTQFNIGKNEGIIFNVSNKSNSDKDSSLWDKISKIPLIFKLIASLIIASIVIVLFLFLKKGYTVETSYIKIIPPPTTDTIVRLSQPEKQVKPNKSNNMDFFKNKKQSDNTKNVNSGSGTQINIEKNEGIVANNSTINIGSELPPRSLKKPSDQRYVEDFLNQTFQQHNRDKKCPIKIRVDYSNQEAIDYANELHTFLKSNGYNVQGDVNLEIFAPPIHQTRVDFEKNQLYQDNDSTVHIKVGINKPR